MTVNIAVEGPACEVERALSLMEGVLALVYVERNQWEIPVPTVRVMVNATACRPASEA